MFLTLAPIVLPSGNEPAKCGSDKRLSNEIYARKKNSLSRLETKLRHPGRSLSLSFFLAYSTNANTNKNNRPC